MFLKPSRMSSTEALSRNESQEFSFSEAATKGMQPLRETVSEFEMLTRAGKDNFCCYLCSPLPLHLCTFPAPLILAFLGLCTVTLNVPRLSPTLSPVVNRFHLWLTVSLLTTDLQQRLSFGWGGWELGGCIWGTRFAEAFWAGIMFLQRSVPDSSDECEPPSPERSAFTVLWRPAGIQLTVHIPRCINRIWAVFWGPDSTPVPARAN